MARTAAGTPTPIDEGMIAAASGGFARRPPGTTKVGALLERLVGWMGPGIPPPTISPPVEPRVLDYRPGINLAFAPDRGPGRPRFEQLRALSRRCWQIRLAIETCKVHIRQLEWRVTFADRERAKAYTRALRRGDEPDPRIVEITRALRRPDGSLTWRQWVAQIVEDALAIGAVAVYPRRTRAGAIAGKGGVVALEVFDAATIVRRFDERGQIPAPPLEAYTQVIRGQPAVPFRSDQLVYWAPNRPSDLAYGTCPVEWIELIVNSAIRRELWRLQNYTGGSIPDAIIATPESWSAEKIREFQTFWDAEQFDNQEAQHGAKFVPGGPGTNVFFTKEKLLADDVDEWLTRVVGYAFGQSPSWFVKSMNRATAEELGRVAMQEGRLPLMADIGDFVDAIIQTAWGYDDLHFEFEDPRTLDIEVKSKVIASTGVYTRNEARQELDLDPLPVDFVEINGRAVPVADLEDVLADSGMPPGGAGGATSGGEGGDEDTGAGRRASGAGGVATETRAAAPRQRRSGARLSPPSPQRNSAGWPSRRGRARRSGGQISCSPSWSKY